ncbi:NAD(P)-dependent alcohol dehydrogenase [Halieaceae bacterium IMCC14734]|uniref:NAD(P)-dependent alcohol dehydrogenase n=1 Tax=Candidatus Litorirhabdus singularis TaxID=2518993 RepID=A0ABT3TD69_9GAMM|nr:NAD(P)-dependent alcohol dehydrogenase [Candidatus Litorirhabdus singularis]MCX2980245.1 NAD(P)-dependent alcohol dehydrogenase [Candidatus Litorirhabdus singularis]
MQAIHLKQPGGLDNLILESAEAPAPGPGEITIRNKASSLNFHDYAVVIGLIAVDQDRIPMSDGAGIVEAVGAGVTEFAVGDKVMSCFFPHWESGRADAFAKITDVPGDMADGFAAELVTKSVSAFTRMPEGYSFEAAATLPCAALTAWRALMVEAKIKPGDSVLVQGSGGVSVFALQFAKAAGCHVIATSSSDAKLQRLSELGADQTINYKETPAWGDKVLEITGGRGVDVIVEVGGSGTLPQSIRAVRMGGHISMIGVLTGISGDVPTAELFQKNAVVSGITVGSRESQLDMVAALETNGIKPVIDRCFGLSEIADAFRLQESQQHFGKICLTI